jgi:signal transduction histidine kinase
LFGVVLPLLCAILYAQLAIFGFVHAPLSNLLWFLGALMVSAYEVGRDFLLRRRAQLELVELREQLAQAERVSVLGHLASALAHELIQPLTATKANVQAARMELDNEEPNLEELRAILEDVDKDDSRAVDIITKMRRFSQRRAIDMQPLAVEDLVQDVLALVHSEAMNKHAVLALVMQPGLPRVLGDRVHLSQVVLNLLVNSIHAVESRPVDERGIVVEARAGETKDEVELAVRDSGHGIPDNIADQLSRPSLRRSRTAWAWGWHSAARSSRPMVVVCGPTACPSKMALSFASHSSGRRVSRSFRPWPGTFQITRGARAHVAERRPTSANPGRFA